MAGQDPQRKRRRRLYQSRGRALRSCSIVNSCPCCPTKIASMRSGARKVSCRTRAIGSCNLRALREFADRCNFTIVQHLPPPERPRQRLDHGIVDLRAWRPFGAVRRHHQLARRACGRSSARGRQSSRRRLPSLPASRCCPPAACHLAHQSCKPVRPQLHLDAMDPHVHPLDQQLHDPRLLGRERRVEEGAIERGEHWRSRRKYGILSHVSDLYDIRQSQVLR
jgi:hypothetical protein